MLLPIFFLLWAARAFAPQPDGGHAATVFSNQNSNETTAPALHFEASDSLIFKELDEKLAARRAALAPEKLYLQLDRTLLQPGETLWFNAYLRNADDLAPARQSQMLDVELLDPRGAVIQRKKLLALDGTAAGEFVFPASLPGGQYKIRAHSSWMRNFNEVFERDITLQKVVLPRLNLKLEFERKAFGPGDVAIARFDAQSIDNKPLANRKLRFTASVRGIECAAGEAQTDASGRAYVRFELPKKLESADGLLNIQIEHEGNAEAISRAIPIVLQKIDLRFFPEGGDAVAGLPCRWAFKAVSEFGKAADVEGQILDDAGREVAVFSSFHNGMGAVEFTPEAGKTYAARLTKPFFSEKNIPLPTTKAEGFILKIKNQTAENLALEVAGTAPGKVFVAATSRDKLFFFKELNLKPQNPETLNSETLNPKPQNPETPKLETLNLPTLNLPCGIVRVTLFDAKKRELAERLAFVNRDRSLRIEIQPEREQYLPREKVRLAVRVRDWLGKPVEGQFSLAVADEKLLTFADDKQGHLLASLLLEQDVRGKIEEPNFYFDEREPKSLQALDYLLMTQGWRRFEWTEVLDNQKFAATHPAERAVIEGHFFNKKGKPARGEKVQLYPDGPTVLTDGNGHFCFEKPDVKRYPYLRFADMHLQPIGGYTSDFRFQGDVVDMNFYVENSPNGSTILTGTVKDGDTRETLIGATVKVMKGKEIVRGGVTNYDGQYRFAVNPGLFDVEISFTGYRTQRVANLQVLHGRINYADFDMSSPEYLNEVVIVEYKVPLIKKDETSGGQTISMGQNRPQPTAAPRPSRPAPQAKAAENQTLTSETIKNLPTKNIVATTAGTTSVDGGEVNIRGNRDNATNFYVDGIRVSGVLRPPVEVEELREVGGGVPANFSNREEAALSEVVVVGADDASSKDFKWNNATRADRQAKPAADERRKKSAPQHANWLSINQFAIARQFYTPVYDEKTPAVGRTDFRPTIYWNPSLRTNANGEATVEFFTSDAITNFRATVEGIGNQGVAGRAERQFFVQKPISVAAKVPHSVIAGDVLKLEIVVSNKTKHPASGQLALAVPPHFFQKNQLPESLNLAAGETRTVLAEFEIGTQKPENQKFEQTISIRFRAPEAFDDGFEIPIRTLDRGYPVRQVFAGSQAQNAFTIPLMQPVEGTLSATLTAYPSPLEDVLKGMERMLRQPGGCFEQVSSSNYPNLLVLDLLRSTGTASPEIESRALAFLESGYKQLTAYECKNGGFDWWGRDPAHEGLTAYGILEFTDMARVFSVDKTLIDRTVRWMESRRDGSGGWKINLQALHGWQNDGVLNAYIAWALAEAGYSQKFQPEIESAYRTAKASDDPYQIALLANALLAAKDARGNELVAQLLKNQALDGSWTGKTHSVLHAYGECFTIETTGLAALASMKTGQHEAATRKAIDFIISKKTEYGYGSTQSTVLALRALVEFAKKGSRQPPNGLLVVAVDGERKTELPFSTQSAKRLEINNFEQFFGASLNPRVEVFFEKNGAVVPFDVEVKYASRQPRNASACPISLTTSVEKNTVRAGETLRLTAVLKNENAAPVASPMLILGIPGGTILQPWQLKKLGEEKRFDFYELWDGFAVFHFEKLAPGEVRELAFDLRADVPGSYEAPASQAFLYYSNEQRVWSKPERVVVE